MRATAIPVCLVLLAACTTSPTDRPGWQLAWADEFDQDGAPDATRWDQEEGRIRNQELQHYTRGRLENARVEAGHLVLEARREDFAGATYTSASLISRGRKSFTHARIEVRARLPQARGIWPAIWLLGDGIDQVGWPKCGEIDVMEFVGHEPDTIHHNVHTEGFNHMRGNGRGTKVKLAQPHAAFHVYAVEWDAERMHFEIDGRTTFTLQNDHTGIASWPFDQPHYLILNVAVGGAWGGQQGVDAAAFPQRMEIDWVRAYTPKR